MKYFDPEFDAWFRNFCEERGVYTPEGMRAMIEALQERMDTEVNLHPPKPEGECFFCHGSTTDWDYCHGCKEHVCQECCGDPELQPCGREHSVHEHKSFQN